MKKDIHPDYHPVVFRDIGADYSFLTRSTAVSNQTVKWEDGNEYPLINIDISSKSHPFYTGQQRFGKARGRIEKFNKRYGKTSDPLRPGRSLPRKDPGSRGEIEKCCEITIRFHSIF